MTTIRALEARLRAWKSFRGIAHAARTLAAAQSLRWSARVTAAARHLAWCDALAKDLGPPPPAPRLPVLVGLSIGQGLGTLSFLGFLAVVAADLGVKRHIKHEGVEGEPRGSSEKPPPAA